MVRNSAGKQGREETLRRFFVQVWRETRKVQRNAVSGRSYTYLAPWQVQFRAICSLEDLHVEPRWAIAWLHVCPVPESKAQTYHGVLVC